MTTPIDLTLASLTAYAPTQRVYTRHAWRDDWTLVPHLHCTSAQSSAAPDIGRGHFTWRFGRGVQPGAGVMADWPRLMFADPSRIIPDDPDTPGNEGSTTGNEVHVDQGIIGRFIKVEWDVYDQIDDPEHDEPITTKWYGYALDSDEALDGASYRPQLDDPDTQRDESEDDWIRVPSGTQSIVAYELTWLLSELSIDNSVVATTSDLVRMNFPLGFNMYKGGPRDTGAFAVRNRSLEKFSGATGESYVFSDSLAPDEAETWSTYDILEYLLEWHAPLSRENDPDARRLSAVPFRIASTSLTESLSWDTPRVNCENRTVWDILTQLLDRRRSVGFFASVDETQTPNVVQLNVFTYNADAIVITDPVTGTTATVPANPDPRSLDVDTNPFSMTQVRRSASAKYDEVLVRGARRRTAFSIAYDDNTLEEDWSSSQQTDYNSAASGLGGYPTRVSLRKIRNHLVRSSDVLWRVYRCFRIPETWDYKANDGEAGGTYHCVLPTLDGSGEPTTTSEQLWRPGLRLLRHLPLLKGFDYSSDAADPTDDTPAGAQPEYLECFVCFKMGSDGSGTDRYAYGHDLADTMRTASVNIPTLPPLFNVAVRPQDHGLGIACDVGGDNQHMIAKSEFAPLSNAGDEDGHLDWQEMIATVAMEGDCYCEALWPQTLENQDATLLKRRLVIDAGDGYRLDYLTPDTVLGLEDGVPLRNPDGGFVRDDRAELLSLARLAYEWYSRERVAIDLSVRAIATDFSLGHLITSFGGAETQETINSVVTSLTWHFGAFAGDQPHTLVHTNYAELDPGSFVRQRNA